MKNNLLLVSLLLLVACTSTEKLNRRYDPGDLVKLKTGEVGIIQSVSATTGYMGTPAYYVRLDNISRINADDSYDVSIRIYEFEIRNLISN